MSVGSFVLGSLSGGAEAATFYVPSEYPTINAGIDVAASGDTVLVAPGVYHGEVRVYQYPYGSQSTASVAFLKDGITVLSEAGSDVTTMDLAGLSSTQSAVIVGALMPSSGNVIEGFTITDSQGVVSHGVLTGQVGRLTLRDCEFIGLTIPSLGAGIEAVEVELELDGCRFANCVAEEGGAIWALESGLTLRGCRVENCGSIGVRLKGEHSPRTVEIIDCVFLDNYATGALGGVSISRFEEATVRDCRFERNVAMDGSAGALSIVETACEVSANVFIANHVGGVGEGGALTIRSAPTAIVIGNTFYGNSQAQPLAHGSAISIGSSFVSLGNNIIAESVGGAAVEHEESGETESSCNVFWGNSGGNTSGLQLGKNDRVVDPLLCDPDNDDLQLMEGSPCLPEHSEGCGLIGAFGLGCGPIAVEEMSWGEIKAKYLENPGGRNHE